MAVGIVLVKSSNCATAVRWAARFAESLHEGLIIFQASKSHKHSTKTMAIDDVSPELSNIVRELLADNFKIETESNESTGTDEHEVDTSRLPLSIESINADSLVSDLTTRAISLSLDMLVLPRDPMIKSTGRDFALHRQILSEVPCEIGQLVVGNSDGRQCDTILVPTGKGSHSRLAVQRGLQIANAFNGTVTSLFVEPELGDDAEAVGNRILDDNLEPSERSDEQPIRKVVLANSVHAGIEKMISHKTDLVILGKQHHGAVYRLLFRSVSESLILQNPGPAILVIQPRVPLASYVIRRVTRFFHSNVPQIEREKRVQLVEKIQSSSQWDFDFVALIFLSTMIAAGGLIQNSSAVVIGAMLVAPLMTPLLGTGLSLVQGNSVLFRNTIFTVLRGFIVAYVLGCILGVITRIQVPTNEMIARGSPGILDLVVASISGIAAAYAIGRPNLLSALPGVAIAASLIPPIATSGIATVLGKQGLALGAAKLFFMNIVAIILGTAFSFWATGIKGAHQHGAFGRWSITAGVVLVSIAIGLCAFGSFPSEQIPHELLEEVNHHLVEMDAQCESIKWVKMKSGDSGLEVLLASPKILPNEVIKTLSGRIGSHFDPSTKIRIQTKIESLFE